MKSDECRPIGLNTAYYGGSVTVLYPWWLNHRRTAAHSAPFELSEGLKNSRSIELLVPPVPKAVHDETRNRNRDDDEHCVPELVTRRNCIFAVMHIGI